MCEDRFGELVNFAKGNFVTMLLFDYIPPVINLKLRLKLRVRPAWYDA